MIMYNEFGVSVTVHSGMYVVRGRNNVVFAVVESDLETLSELI